MKGLDTVESLSDGARDSDLPKVGLLYNVDNSYQNTITINYCRNYMPKLGLF